MYTKRKSVGFFLLTAITFSSSAPLTAQNTFSYEKKLLPAARILTDLSLCTVVADELHGNSKLSEHYLFRTKQLSQKIFEAGWTASDFASAETKAQYEMSEIVVHDGETRESFMLRHYNEGRCENASTNAVDLISGTLPEK